MARSYKEPTTTTLVEEALRARDDFTSTEMLVRSTNRSRNQVSAALHELRKYRVVDVVVDPYGVGWWFALPPEGDTRSRVVAERTPEEPGNRRRRPRAPKIV